MVNNSLERFPVPQIIIPDLPADVHQRLKLLAASHGRSLEAEVCAILKAVIRPESELGLGEALWNLVGPDGRLTEAEWAIFEGQRDCTPAEPMTFD